MIQKIVLEQEAAAILGVPVRSIYEWVKEKKLPALNETNPYQFDLSSVYTFMEKGYKFNLEAYPFFKQEYGDTATITIPKKSRVFNLPKRNYKELFAAVSDTRPLKKLDILWSKYNSRFMSSTIHIDGLGGGIWAREYCFGALLGDGVDDLIDFVIFDKLVIKESFPCDYSGDHTLVINGKTEWVDFALDFLKIK